MKISLIVNTFHRLQETYLKNLIFFLSKAECDYLLFGAPGPQSYTCSCFLILNLLTISASATSRTLFHKISL